MTKMIASSVDMDAIHDEARTEDRRRRVAKVRQGRPEAVDSDGMILALLPAAIEQAHAEAIKHEMLRQRAKRAAARLNRELAAGAPALSAELERAERYEANAFGAQVIEDMTHDRVVELLGKATLQQRIEETRASEARARAAYHARAAEQVPPLVPEDESYRAAMGVLHAEALTEYREVTRARRQPGRHHRGCLAQYDAPGDHRPCTCPPF